MKVAARVKTGKPNYDSRTGNLTPLSRQSQSKADHASHIPRFAFRSPHSPLCTVDQIMAEERAAAFAKRSIKTSAKLAGLKIVTSMMDLTTLEGKDTPGKIAYLCRKALQPAEAKYQIPPCAAVCVYPNMVRYARRFLADNSAVEVAWVATR